MCMAGVGGHVRWLWGGMCGRGVCVAGGGMHGGGGACMAGGVWVVCMAGGMCGGGRAYHACPSPQTPRDTVGKCAGSTHPIGMHSCFKYNDKS